MTVAPTPADWAAAMSLPAAATLVCVLAWAVRP